MKARRLENLRCIILCRNKMFGWGGEYKKETKRETSHISPSPPPPPPRRPAPMSLKPALVEGWGLADGGGGSDEEENCTFMASLPAWPASPGPLPAPRSPSGGPLGGRPPSPLVPRCLQATEPQSVHCPAGAGRPVGPWRRITPRPTPDWESFLKHSLG